MKLNPVFVFILLLSISARAQQLPFPSDRHSFQLSGNVRTLTEYVYDAEKTNGKWSKKENGLDFYHRYEFDFTGHLLMQTDSVLNNTKFEFLYAQGRLEKIKKYPGLGDIAFGTYAYSYNSAGRIEKIVYTDTAGPQLSYTCTFTYDSLGRTTRQVEKFATDSTLYLSAYDSAGHCIDFRFIEKNEESHFVMTYDANGNMLSENFSRNGTALGQTKFTYDQHHNMLSKTETIPGIPEMKTIYHYEYDAHGNWTRCTSEMNHDFTITERVLTYY